VRVALVLAVALVAVGSVAAAAGLIPDDVKQGLGLAGDAVPAMTPDLDKAAMQASATNPDGGTVELWTAPNSGGGTCAYLRHLDPHGRPADARGVGCEAPVDGGSATAGFSQHEGAVGGSIVLGYLGNVHLEWGDGEPVTLYGKAPAGTVEVAVTQADGTATTA